MSDNYQIITRDLLAREKLAPFKEFLSEDGITEVAVNDYRSGWLYVEKNGRWERRLFPLDGAVRDEAGAFDLKSQEAALNMLIELGTACAALNANVFDDTHPILSVTLPDGERAQFVRAPAVMDGQFSLTIRRPSFVRRVLADYDRQGFFSKVATVAHARPKARELAELYKTLGRNDISAEERSEAIQEFLRLAVVWGRTIVIAGGTGSGKTTFMKALMQEIPTDERIITIEDVPELTYGLPEHKNVVNLLYPSEARSGSEASPVTASTLMKSCLRMKPDRILIAELRSGETYDWLNACLSGHSGSITSCHSNNCRAVFDYLALKVIMSETASTIPMKQIDQLLHQVIDVVVHIACVHGERNITEIWYEPEVEV